MKEESEEVYFPKCHAISLINLNKPNYIMETVSKSPNNTFFGDQQIYRH